MNTKAELIEIGNRFLEHAPPSSSGADGLSGWKGGIVVCCDCASRILARGCALSMLADEPVWSPDVVKCDLCGGVK